jgi:hypothetical protein
VKTNRCSDEFFAKFEKESDIQNGLWLIEILGVCKKLFGELSRPEKYKLTSIFLKHEHADVALLKSTLSLSDHFIRECEKRMSSSGIYKYHNFEKLFL